jgi:hypothetical protein
MLGAGSWLFVPQHPLSPRPCCHVVISCPNDPAQCLKIWGRGHIPMMMKKNKCSLSRSLSLILSDMNEYPQVPDGMSDLPPGYASRNTAADIQSNKDAVIPLSSPININHFGQKPYLLLTGLTCYPTQIDYCCNTFDTLNLRMKCIAALTPGPFLA